MYLNYARYSHYHQASVCDSESCLLAKMVFGGIFELHVDGTKLVNLTKHGEEEFPFMDARQFTQDHIVLAFQIAFAYIAIVFSLKWFMKDREPFELRAVLIIWNFILSAFSIIATIKTAPHLIQQVRNLGMFGAGCEGLTTMPSPVEYWMFLTLLSKFFEFVDTFLLVLRKKPLIFLHWYHHIATFLFFSISYPTPSSQFRMGAIMNLMVHSVMYPYYFCRAMQIKVSGAVARLITVLQLVQFVFFVYGSIVMYFQIAIGKYNCDSPMIELHSASWMNLSYLLLFANFFYQSYIKKGGKEKYKLAKSE